MATASIAGPLAGTVVLDLSRLQPGAQCTRLLRDLGADVVKLEPPGGDATRLSVDDRPSPSSVALHHGKRSVTFDLRREGAAQALARLVAHADVVVESARPGTMESGGMGYDTLSAANPSLVWCSITGFGQTGPYRDVPGHDLTYLGYAGALAALTDLAVEPGQPRLLLAAPLAGAIAALGIVAALAARARTGRGCRIDASIADAATWLVGEDITRASRGAPPWDLESPARRCYPCADGRWVSVAAADPRTWAALCTGLGLEGLGDVPGGPPDRMKETARRIADALVLEPAAHWVSSLGVAAAIGPVNQPQDVARDPHALARDAIRAVDGDVVASGPLRFPGNDDWTERAGARCDLGADADDVLASFGFDEDDIESLRRDGIVGGTR